MVEHGVGRADCPIEAVRMARTVMVSLHGVDGHTGFLDLGPVAFNDASSADSRDVAGTDDEIRFDDLDRFHSPSEGGDAFLAESVPCLSR